VVVVVVAAGVRRVAVARLGPRSLVFRLGRAALRVVLVVRGATVVWWVRRPIGMMNECWRGCTEYGDLEFWYVVEGFV
jgi:hypothetical protein